MSHTHPIAPTGHEIVPSVPMEVAAANPLADILECVEPGRLLPFLQIAGNPDLFSRKGEIVAVAGFIRKDVRIDVARVAILASYINPRHHRLKILSELQPVSTRGHMNRVAGMGSILEPAASSVLNVEGVVRALIGNDTPGAD